MENENKEVLKTNSNEKVTATVSKPYYDKFKDQISIHSKKHVLGGVIAAVALVTCGGLAAGHFAYKATHPRQDTIEERIIVNPELQDKASITTPVIDEQGNAHTSVSVRDKEMDCISDVDVYIGDWKCTPEEYEIIDGNAAEEKPQSFEVIIKKEALEIHQGKISVTPKIEVIKREIHFTVKDIITQKSYTKLTEVEFKKNPVAPTFTELTSGLKVIGWTYNDNPVDLNTWTVPVDHETKEYNFVGIVTDTVCYDAIFNLNYPDCPKAQVVSVPRGSKVSKPADPIREGYHFDGWYDKETGGNLFDFETTFSASSKDLYAHWTINQYTISFDPAGGTDVGTGNVITKNYKQKLTAAECDTTRTGYDFAGWYNGGTLYNFDNEITKDLSLVAHWTATKVTVTFKDTLKTEHGPFTDIPVEIDYDTVVPVPANPVKDGYIFAGWFKDKECTDPFDFTSTIKASTNAYAKWNCVVSFNAQNGSAIHVVNVQYGSTVSTPTPEPTKDHYTFAQWHLQPNTASQYDFSKSVTQSLTLFAHWNIETHKVYFNKQDGSAETPVDVDYGNIVARPQDPTREGYTFKYWYKTGESSEFDFTTPIVEDIHLNAKWEQITCTVTFVYNNGDPTTIQDVNYNSSVDKPEEPVKYGYKFNYWTLNGGEYDFSDPVTENIILEANWTENTPATIQLTSDGISLGSGTGKVDCKLLDGRGEEIECAGRVIFEITNRASGAEKVYISPTTGAITSDVDSGVPGSDAVTVEATYYGPTFYSSNTLVVKFID